MPTVPELEIESPSVVLDAPALPSELKVDELPFRSKDEPEDLPNRIIRIPIEPPIDYLNNP